MKIILVLLAVVCFSSNTYGATDIVVYNCTQICGSCEDNSCCTPWYGRIESTSDPDIYHYKYDNAGKEEFYAFYKTNPGNNYVTQFEIVENQELIISESMASFNMGPDDIVECFKLK